MSSRCQKTKLLLYQTSYNIIRPHIPVQLQRQKLVLPLYIHKYVFAFCLLFFKDLSERSTRWVTWNREKFPKILFIPHWIFESSITWRRTTTTSTIISVIISTFLTILSRWFITNFSFFSKSHSLQHLLMIFLTLLFYRPIFSFYNMYTNVVNNQSITQHQ